MDKFDPNLATIHLFRKDLRIGTHAFATLIGISDKGINIIATKHVRDVNRLRKVFKVEKKGITRPTLEDLVKADKEGGIRLSRFSCCIK